MDALNFRQKKRPAGADLLLHTQLKADKRLTWRASRRAPGDNGVVRIGLAPTRCRTRPLLSPGDRSLGFEWRRRWRWLWVWRLWLTSMDLLSLWQKKRPAGADLLLHTQLKAEAGIATGSRGQQRCPTYGWRSPTRCRTKPLLSPGDRSLGFEWRRRWRWLWVWRLWLTSMDASSFRQKKRPAEADLLLHTQLIADKRLTWRSSGQPCHTWLSYSYHPCNWLVDKSPISKRLQAVTNIEPL
ncbi:hypothetical protein F0521_24400 [Ferrimonas sp. YFM]|nr:hypothetical protein F0521_24400 [Ferrimonas sp. YFM]